MTSPHFTTSPHFGDVPTFWVPEKKSGDVVRPLTTSLHFAILATSPHFRVSKMWGRRQVLERSCQRKTCLPPWPLYRWPPEKKWGRRPVVGTSSRVLTSPQPGGVPIFSRSTSPHFGLIRRRLHFFSKSPRFSIGRTGSTIAFIVSGMALGLFLSLPPQVQPGINKNAVLGQHFAQSTRFRPPTAGHEKIS